MTEPATIPEQALVESAVPLQHVLDFLLQWALFLATYIVISTTPNA